MRTPLRLWNTQDDRDTPLLDTVAIPGSDPLQGYWLPILPQPAIAAPAPPAPAAELVQMALVDLTSELSSLGRAQPAAASLSIAESALATRTAYTSGAPGAYNITLQFKGLWPIALQNVFIAAADRISTIILGDLPAVKVGAAMVDDILISAELASIDGPGGMLGQAGPTALRSASLLPATATMRFDDADAKSYYNQGLFDEIVTHEMLHSIGFGAIWDRMDLISQAGFIGPNAVAEYDRLVDAYAASQGASTTLPNGTSLLRGAVPIELEGGEGTAHAHWSEAALDTELMTGWLDLPRAVSAMAPDPLSTLTVASLRDLGYTVSATPAVDLYYLS